MSSPAVRFTFPTQEQYDEALEAAESRNLKLDEFARFCIAQYVSKYPTKKRNVKRHVENVGSGKAVQPELSAVKSEDIPSEGKGAKDYER